MKKSYFEKYSFCHHVIHSALLKSNQLINSLSKLIFISELDVWMIAIVIERQKMGNKLLSNFHIKQINSLLDY